MKIKKELADSDCRSGVRKKGRIKRWKIETKIQRGYRKKGSKRRIQPGAKRRLRVSTRRPKYGASTS
jgi:hypothetical protein